MLKDTSASKNDVPAKCFRLQEIRCILHAHLDCARHAGTFVETDTTLDTVMHDLAHDLVHPDRQDEHKIRHCLRQISDARVGVSLLVFTQAQSLSISALSLAKAFPMLLLKMRILPQRFEKQVLHVAHAAGELCLQVHNHLLHLLGVRTLELLQVIPRRGMNSFHMSLPSLSMSLPLNKWFAQLDLFRGMILACPLSTLRLGDQAASAMRSCFLEICPSVKACLCNPWSF